MLTDFSDSTASTARLLLASGNPKKLAELRAMLAPAGVEVVAPEEVFGPAGLPEVVEDRPDFAGNAEKKAVAAAHASGLPALADDSGLEVDALDGAPGVRSARFAGEPADDEANNTLLLERLADVPDESRGARFVCALCLVGADGSVLARVEGESHGRILREHRGDRDFGYDPLFLFTEPGHPETDRAFAELDAPEKAAVSHRGRAVRELASRVPSLLAGATQGTNQSTNQGAS